MMLDADGTSEFTMVAFDLRDEEHREQVHSLAFSPLLFPLCVSVTRFLAVFFCAHVRLFSQQILSRCLLVDIFSFPFLSILSTCMCMCFVLCSPCPSKMGREKENVFSLMRSLPLFFLLSLLFRGLHRWKSAGTGSQICTARLRELWRPCHPTQKKEDSCSRGFAFHCCCLTTQKPSLTVFFFGSQVEHLEQQVDALNRKPQ